MLPRPSKLRGFGVEDDLQPENVLQGLNQALDCVNRAFLLNEKPLGGEGWNSMASQCEKAFLKEATSTFPFVIVIGPTNWGRGEDFRDILAKMKGLSEVLRRPSYRWRVCLARVLSFARYDLESVSFTDSTSVLDDLGEFQREFKFEDSQPSNENSDIFCLLYVLSFFLGSNRNQLDRTSVGDVKSLQQELLRILDPCTDPFPPSLFVPFLGGCPKGIRCKKTLDDALDHFAKLQRDWLMLAEGLGDGEPHCIAENTFASVVVSLQKKWFLGGLLHTDFYVTDANGSSRTDDQRAKDVSCFFGDDAVPDQERDSICCEGVNLIYRDVYAEASFSTLRLMDGLEMPSVISIAALFVNSRDRGAAKTRETMKNVSVRCWREQVPGDLVLIVGMIQPNQLCDLGVKSPSRFGNLALYCFDEWLRRYEFLGFGENVNYPVLAETKYQHATNTGGQLFGHPYLFCLRRRFFVIDLTDEAYSEFQRRIWESGTDTKRIRKTIQTFETIVFQVLSWLAGNTQEEEEEEEGEGGRRGGKDLKKAINRPPFALERVNQKTMVQALSSQISSQVTDGTVLSLKYYASELKKCVDQL